MKNIYTILLAVLVSNSIASTTGLYLGGGLGYGMQDLTMNGGASVQASPTIRGFVGYQFASFLGAEAGYTYISQGQSWNNLGPASTTVYDLAITPGFEIPLTPVSLYARLGVDAISPNLSSNWYNQFFSNMTGNFEWGAGVKVDIPITSVFVRLEYTNYGGASNNNNSNLNVTPSTVMVNAAYVF